MTAPGSAPNHPPMADGEPDAASEALDAKAEAATADVDDAASGIPDGASVPDRAAETDAASDIPPTNGKASAFAANPTRYPLLGATLDALTMEQTVARCMAAVEHGERLEIGVVNAAKLVRMRDDAALRAAVTGCDLVVADGQSVVWASRILRAPLPERVAGIDLFVRLLAEAERHGHGVYLLGAKEDVLARTVEEIRRRFPKLDIAGSHHGYYAQDEAGAIADRIRESGARMLFLGMTSPRKEIFTATHGERTGVNVVHGVGGSFDVLAGVTRRAPEVWQRAGMEWLYRLLQEPRRLGPRYLTTNTAFILMVARARMRRPSAVREGKG